MYNWEQKNVPLFADFQMHLFNAVNELRKFYSEQILTFNIYNDSSMKKLTQNQNLTTMV